MRFFKEIIALITIITFLIGIDIFVAQYTEKAMEEMDKNLDAIIANSLKKEGYSKEDELKRIQNFENEWKKKESALSYFSEHEELEKVRSLIVKMKANVEADMKEDAYEKMKDIKFMLGHIKSKPKVQLNNIF